MSEPDNRSEGGQISREMPLDDLALKCIGRFASAWGLLESELDQAIWIHGHMKEEVGACITLSMGGFYSRFRALIALIQLHEGVSPETIKLLNKLARDAGELLAKRDRFVKDSWMHGDSGETAQFRVTAHKEPDPEILATALAELEIAVSEIGGLRKWFQELCLRVADESYSAWKKNNHNPAQPSMFQRSDS
jgi:hypothetical protein